MKISEEVSALLQEFAVDEDKHIAMVAGEIQTLNASYEAGNIDEDTHKELIQDALELAQVGEAAELLETKVKIEKLIDFAKMVAKFI